MAYFYGSFPRGFYNVSSRVSRSNAITGTLDFSNESETPMLPVVYGTARVEALPIFYQQGFGQKRKFKGFVFALSEGEIESVGALYLNGKVMVNLGQGTGVAGQMPSTVYRYSTVFDKTRYFVAQSTLGSDDGELLECFDYTGKDRKLPTNGTGWGTLAAGCQWTTSMESKGFASVGLMYHDYDDIDMGEADLQATVQGRKIYDPRDDATKVYYSATRTVDQHETDGSTTTTDISFDGTQREDDPTTWKFSSNAALCILDYLRNERFGGSIPLSKLDIDSFIASADHCDTRIRQLVTNYHREWDGESRSWLSFNNQTTTTVPVYTCNGQLDGAEKFVENVKNMLICCAGRLSYVGGQYAMEVGRDRATVYDFDDDNMQAATLQVDYGDVAKRYNQVKVKWRNPLWGSGDKFTYVWTDDDALAYDDGEINSLKIESSMLGTIEQAALLAKVALKESRRQEVVTFSSNIEGHNIKPNEVISITNSLLGWTNRTFEVMDITKRKDGTFDIRAKQFDANTYDFLSTALDVDNSTVDLPRADEVYTPENLTYTELPYEESGAGILKWELPDAVVKRFRVYYTNSTVTSGDLDTTYDGNLLEAGFEFIGEVVVNQDYEEYAFVVDNLDVGSYSFAVTSVNELGAESSPAMLNQGVSSDNLDMPTINNLANAGEGDATNFLGNILKVRWDDVTQDPVEIGGGVVSTGVISKIGRTSFIKYFSHYEVVFYNSEGNIKTIKTANPAAELSIDEYRAAVAADVSLTQLERTINVDVRVVAKSGQLGAFTTGTWTNPNMAVPANITATPNVGGFTVSFDTPTDDDYKITHVYFSRTSGFNIGDSGVESETSTDSVVVCHVPDPVDPDTWDDYTWYVRVGLTDNYEDVPSNLSAQITVDPITKDVAVAKDMYIVYNASAPTVTPNAPLLDGTNDGWHTVVTASDNWMSHIVTDSLSNPANVWATPWMFIGVGLEVQYSDDLISWHAVFVDGDTHMRQRVGPTGAWSDPMQIVGESGPALQIEYSVNGSTSWHSTWVSGDLYMRQSTDEGSTWSAAILIVGESGQYTDVIFRRAATAPATPTGDNPASWFDGPPVDDGNPLWMSTGPKNGDGTLISTWSAPVEMTGNDGADGDPADQTLFEYSVDGSTSWHSTYNSADKYFRSSTDGGNTWSAAILFVGEDGSYTDYIFIRAASLPATPTGENPASWSDSPPADNGQLLWMSKANRNGDGTLDGAWSIPVQMTGDTGPHVEFRFTRNEGTPSVDNTIGDPGVDWQDAPYGDSTDGFLWMIQAEYLATTQTGNWSTPVKITGENGAGTFHLESTANCTVTPNSAVGTSATDWAAGAQSVESYDDPVFASCRLIRASDRLMFGLSNDDTNSSTYTTIDYAIYRNSTDGIAVYENGTSVGTFETATDNDVFTVHNNGNHVSYKKNGVTFYISNVTPSGAYRFDCSFAGIGDGCYDISFGKIGDNADPMYTWIVFSNSETAGLISTTNDADYSYTGIRHNNTDPTVVTNDHSLYEWVRIKAVADDIFTASEQTSLDNLIAGLQQDGTGWGALAQLDTIGNTEIDDDAIRTQHILANNITAGHILAGEIDTQHLAVNAVEAGNINVSNLAAIAATMGTVTSGTFRTASSGKRAIMSDSGLPFQLYDDNNNLTFYMKTDGTAYLAGGLAPDVIDNINVFTDEVFEQLRPDIVDSVSTGGTVSITNQSFTTPQTYTLTAMESGGNQNTLTFKFSDYHNEFATGPTSYTAPSYSVTLKRDGTTIYGPTTHTGNVQNAFFIPQDGYWEGGTYDIDIELSETDTPAAGSVVYTAEVTRVSGSFDNPKLNEFTAFEPIVSAGGLAGAATFPYIGLDETGSSNYPRMNPVNDESSNPNTWIRVGTAGGHGLLPYLNGISSLGTNSWRFANVYSNNFYEGGTNLTAKYATIDNPSFTGNMTTTGLIDGRDIAADGATLDTISGDVTVHTVSATAPSSPTSGDVWFDTDDTPSFSEMRLDAAGRLYLDGGSHTYIYEATNDNVQIVINSTARFGCDASGVGVASVDRVYFDGVGADGNTYIQENTADNLRMVAGGTERLNVNSSGCQIVGTMSATTVNSTSDERLKTNIKDYDGSEFDKLSPIVYDWKNGWSEKQIGYSAQQAQELNPHCVSVDEDDILSLNYAMVHTGKIFSLEKKNRELENRLNKMEALLKELIDGKLN